MDLLMLGMYNTIINVIIAYSCRYFLDAPDIHGDYVQRRLIQAVFKMQNLSNGGLNDNCLANMSTDEQWKCVFVPYMYPYIKTPMFTYNSAFDTWQLQNTLGLNCLPPNCSTEQMQELENYGQVITLTTLYNLQCTELL